MDLNMAWPFDDMPYDFDKMLTIADFCLSSCSVFLVTLNSNLAFPCYLMSQRILNLIMLHLNHRAEFLSWPIQQMVWWCYFSTRLLTCQEAPLILIFYISSFNKCLFSQFLEESSGNRTWTYVLNLRKNRSSKKRACRINLILRTKNIGICLTSYKMQC